jgi:hypothetical protein
VAGWERVIKLALFGTILSLRGFVYTSNNQFAQKNLI